MAEIPAGLSRFSYVDRALDRSWDRSHSRVLASISWLFSVKRSWLRLLGNGAAFVSLMPAAAHADLDGISTVVGSGEDASMVSVGMVWDWNRQWLKAGDWSLGGYWEANVSYWQGKGEGGRSIGGAGITPVFRYGPSRAKVVPYLEAGVGAHVFSNVRISDAKRMGTEFEFGDLVGVGLRFGKDHRHELGYRYQHYSNAGISDNNGGVNFHQIRFRYGF